MKADERIEKLLALILLEQMKGSTQREKATKLSVAGFSNIEIADILQINSSRVADALYEARHASPPRKPPSKKVPPKPGTTE